MEVEVEEETEMEEEETEMEEEETEMEEEKETEMVTEEGVDPVPLTPQPPALLLHLDLILRQPWPLILSFLLPFLQLVAIDTLHQTLQADTQHHTPHNAPHNTPHHTL